MCGAGGAAPNRGLNGVNADKFCAFAVAYPRLEDGSRFFEAHSHAVFSVCPLFAGAVVVVEDGCFVSSHIVLFLQI